MECIPLITLHMRYTVPFLCALLFLCRTLIIMQWWRWMSVLSTLVANLGSILIFRWYLHDVKGVYGYCEGASVLDSHALGAWPVEDLLWMIVQPVSTSVLCCIIFDYKPAVLVLKPKSFPSTWRLRFKGFALCMTAAIMASVASWLDEDNELPLLVDVLWWMMPPLAAEWFVVGPYLQDFNAKILLLPVLISTGYWVFEYMIASSYHNSWHVDSALSLVTFVPFWSTAAISVDEIVYIFLNSLTAMLAMVIADVVFTYDRYGMRRRDVVVAVSPSRPPDPLRKALGAYIYYAWNIADIDACVDWQHVNDVKLSYQLIREGSKSFSIAAAMFPQDVREAIYELYGFCRVTDDMVDTCLTQVEKRKVLLLLQEYLDEVYNVPDRERSPFVIDSLHMKAQAKLGKLWDQWVTAYEANEHFECEFGQSHAKFVEDVHVAMRCMERIIRRFGLAKSEVQELIDGYYWDAEERKMETVDQLLVYCQAVASSVGVMCCRVFGISDTRTLRYARDMGIALQLTNIARDIITDAEEGRIYVPAVFFPTEGKRKQLIEDPYHDLAWAKSTAIKLLDMAEEYYYIAENFGIPSLPRDAQVAVLLASKAYWAIGAIIRKCLVYPKRAYVPLVRKLRVLVEVLFVIN
mmetsp:Transcript_34521/g.97379  ORF Transcript_34521/g.97379 Transcript_34521/m.97379 type:complete len:634 (+) Transcript_34521:181-2082(+)